VRNDATATGSAPEGVADPSDAVSHRPVLGDLASSGSPLPVTLLIGAMLLLVAGSRLAFGRSSGRRA